MVQKPFDSMIVNNKRAKKIIKLLNSNLKKINSLTE